MERTLKQLFTTTGSTIMKNVKLLISIAPVIILLGLYSSAGFGQTTNQTSGQSATTDKKTETLGERYGRLGLDRAYGIGDRKPGLDYNLGPRGLDPKSKDILSSGRNTNAGRTGGPSDGHDFTVSPNGNNGTVISGGRQDPRPLSAEDKKFLDDWSIVSWEKGNGRVVTEYENGAKVFDDGKHITVIYHGESATFETHEHPLENRFQEAVEQMRYIQVLIERLPPPRELDCVNKGPRPKIHLH